MQAEGEFAVGERLGRDAEEERHLIQAAQRGDLSAFDSLVDLHVHKVASVVGRFLQDPNDAEDALQETFVRAFQSLRGFRGEASVRTWLIRIAINVCKSRCGGFWSRRVCLRDGSAHFYAETADARRLAETALLHGEWEDTLRRQLGQLPDTLRLPIILHFFEDLSGAEIAAVLGWKESTVWSRIYAGCRRLRQRLALLQEETES